MKFLTQWIVFIENFTVRKDIMFNKLKKLEKEQKKLKEDSNSRELTDWEKAKLKFNAIMV